MAKGDGQKLKLLYILKILNEQTDENHPITTKTLIDALADYDVSAERKTIYRDIECLITFGYDIISLQSRIGGGYYMASREFELPELKLLVDAVQASRFITLRKSKQLIGKIEKLAGKNDARQLQRQVYVAGRIKTENESIYYNIDYIHRAIQNNEQVTFQYLEWTIEKELRAKRDGQTYQVSPWMLTWKDENYYLVAYEEKDHKIKHYRVDKMSNIKSKKGIMRIGEEALDSFDIAAYTNRTFGMFGGETQSVTLQLPNHLVGVAIDRFGREVSIRKRDEAFFSVRVDVAVSGQFFGWITGLGEGITILTPESVKQQYIAYIKGIMKQYR